MVFLILCGHDRKVLEKRRLDYTRVSKKTMITANDYDCQKVAKWKREPYSQVAAVLPISRFEDWPSMAELNQLRLAQAPEIPKFVPQTECSEELYYEQWIYERNKVPTRSENWHDLFNAISWMLFPQSKRVLNQQHVEDIRQQGLNPRTPRRNRLTHFDECGVILATSNPEILAMLAQHQWCDAWVEHRQCWGKTIQAFVFGHANYEMLLQPFIGLTGKWLGVCVDEPFWQLSPMQQHQHIDAQVAKRIQTDNIFAEKGQLKPLPLLGIPGWHSGNENPEFYLNTDYFRPKSSPKA